MELRTDPAALREKYQKVMDKFVYEGGEPEEKARLRHLLRNQWTFVTSMAPEPEDWNAWTEERVREFEEFFNSIDKIDIWDNSLMSLIREICDPYFAGATDLDETIRLLQNRVGLYLSEQM